MMRSRNITSPLPVPTPNSLLHPQMLILCHPHPRRLALPTLTPPLRAHIRAPSNPNPERPLIAPRSPRPSRAPRNREVVEPKAEPRARDADQAAEQDVEAKVAEVGEARGADVDCGADGDEDEGEGPDGWGGVLVADGDDVFLCIGGEVGLVLGEGHRGLLFDVGGRDGGGVVRVGGEGARGEEGDHDREFGGEEEGEVEEAGPGDCRWFSMEC